MRKQIDTFSRWSMIAAMVVVLCGLMMPGASAQSTKDSENQFCVVEKTLQIPALDSTILAITTITKTIKLVCAAERSIYVQAKQQKIAVNGLRKTFKLVSKIKMFKAFAAAAVPFGNTIYKALDTTQKVTQGKFCTAFAKWDDIWNVLGGAIYAIKLVSTGLCKKTKALGFTICKGFKSGGFGDKQCGTDNDSSDESDEEHSSCNSSKTGLTPTQLRQRTALLKLTAQSQGLLKNVNSKVGAIAKALTSVSGVNNIKSDVASVSKSFNKVKKELDKLNKGLGPISKVTNKLQQVLNKRICVPNPFPGRVADCPKGYTNNGLTCGRGAHSYGQKSRVADCPSGYKNMGATCYRGPHSYGQKSRVADCPSGYRNMGAHCQIKKFPYLKTKGMGSMKCKSNEFRKGARCYKNCKSGYKNMGESCHKAASSLGMGRMKCKRGEFKTGARCYKNCKSGYKNMGETCHRAVSTKGIGSMKCKSNENKRGARCFKKSEKAEICATPQYILDGGKIGKAVQGLMDKAIDLVLKPIQKELQKVLPKVKITSLSGPAKKLGKAINTLKSLGSRLKSQTGIKQLVAPFKGLQSKLNNIR